MKLLLYVLFWHGFIASVAVYIPANNRTAGQTEHTELTNPDLALNETKDIANDSASQGAGSPDRDGSSTPYSVSERSSLNKTEKKMELNLQNASQVLNFDFNMMNFSSDKIHPRANGTNVSVSLNVYTTTPSIQNNTTPNATDFSNQTYSRTSGFIGHIISRIWNSSYWMNNSTDLPTRSNFSEAIASLNISDKFIWQRNTSISTEMPIINTRADTGVPDINETINETAADDIQLATEFNASYTSTVDVDKTQRPDTWESLNDSKETGPLLKTFNDTRVRPNEDKLSILKDSQIDKANNSDFRDTTTGFNVNKSVSLPNIPDKSKNITGNNRVNWDKNIYVTESGQTKTKLSSALNSYMPGTESTAKKHMPSANENSIKIPMAVTLNPIVKHHYSGVVKGILLQELKHGTWDNQVPIDDDPFGSLIWRDRKYLISVLVPIGVGITGAVVIVIVAYVVRSYKRKLKRRAFTSPSRIFRPQAQLAIMDDVLLLDDSSDDGF